MLRNFLKGVGFASVFLLTVALVVGVFLGTMLLFTVSTFWGIVALLVLVHIGGGVVYMLERGY